MEVRVLHFPQTDIKVTPMDYEKSHSYNVISRQPWKRVFREIHSKPQMADKHMKMCSVSAAVREMQTGTTRTHHYIATRMAKTKLNKTTTPRVLGRMWRKLLVKYVTSGKVKWHSRYGKVWLFLKVLDTQPPHDVVTALLGIYPRKTKTYVHIKTCI